VKLVLQPSNDQHPMHETSMFDLVDRAFFLRKSLHDALPMNLAVSNVLLDVCVKWTIDFLNNREISSAKFWVYVIKYPIGNYCPLQKAVKTALRLEK